jgi:hypothetical protein
LEQEVHARLVESLRRPVLTVESERENTEPNHDICDLFQIRFAEIDEKVAHTDFQVSEFKEAINGFVKDVATDLRSQEKFDHLDGVPTGKNVWVFRNEGGIGSSQCQLRSR